MSDSEYETDSEHEAPKVTVTTVQKKKQTSQAKLDQLKAARLAKVAKREERLKNSSKLPKPVRKAQPVALQSDSEPETVIVKKPKTKKIAIKKKKKVIVYESESSSEDESEPEIRYVKKVARKPRRHVQYDDEPHEEHQQQVHPPQQQHFMHPPNRKANGDVMWN